MDPWRKKTTTTSQPPFRFLDLPAELRVRIYRYALGSLPPSAAIWSEKIACEPKTLLRVCKQVRAEANDEFFRCLSAEAARLEQEKIGLFAQQDRIQTERHRQRCGLSPCDELGMLLAEEESRIVKREVEETMDIVLKLGSRCFKRSFRFPSRWL